jgi:hypothetical protein
LRRQKPLAAFMDELVCLDMKTPPMNGQAFDRLEIGRKVTD